MTCIRESFEVVHCAFGRSNLIFSHEAIKLNATPEAMGGLSMTGVGTGLQDYEFQSSKIFPRLVLTVA